MKKGEEKVTLKKWRYVEGSQKRRKSGTSSGSGAPPRGDSGPRAPCGCSPEARAPVLASHPSLGAVSPSSSGTLSRLLEPSVRSA